MGIPVYDGSCIGCGKCLYICPGLAISLVDFRKDGDNPVVSLPYEIALTNPLDLKRNDNNEIGHDSTTPNPSNFEGNCQNMKVNKGEEIDVVDIDGELLGKYAVVDILYNTQYKTQIVKVQMPKELAFRAISFRIKPTPTSLVVASYYPTGEGDSIDENTMICLCERVSVFEVKQWIRKGVTDINQIKALTRCGMGPCGSKTCDTLLKQVFRQEGVALGDIVENVRRPVFIEVPLEKFVDNEGRRL